MKNRSLAVILSVGTALLVPAIWTGCSTTSPGATPTKVPTSTPLPTGTRTFTLTASPTPSRTNTSTRTNTPTPTWTWTLGPSATSTATVAGVLGYVACLSGRNAANTPLPEVYTAAAATGGTLSSWTSQTVLTAGASRQGGALYHNGYVYYMGGLTFGSAAMTSVYSAPVSGTTVGSANNVGSFPAIGREFGVTKWGSIAYIAGGSLGTAYSSAVYSATLYPNGQIGGWISNAVLPVALAWFPIVTDGSYAWLTGGNAQGSPESPTVYVGTISGGMITSWTTTNPLPAGVQGHRSILLGNKIYVVGGSQAGTRVSTVYEGTISGSTVTWATGPSLPVGMSFHAGPVAAGSYVYVYTGGAGTNPESPDVYAALWNGTSLGSWTTNTALPVSLSAASGAAW